MTLRDLARLAGVSHTTVSRALHDNPRLSLDTRTRIQALAKQHGYRPHPLISKLMAQLSSIKTIRHSTLALVTSFPGWRQAPFVSEIYEGIKARAEELGFALEEFALAAHGMSCRHLSDVLYARGIEGVIIFPLAKSPGHLSLTWSRFSSVAIGQTLAAPSLHRISFSHFGNVLLALRHLRKLGYCRVAMVLEHWLQFRGGDAYIAAYGLYQRDIPRRDRVPIFIRPKLDPAEVAAWLRKFHADAVLCNYNPTPEALHKQGFEIPEQLGYATLDRYSDRGELTGIEQRPRFVGMAAVDVLTAHMHRNERGIPPFPKLTVIQGEWIEGRTVRRVTANPPVARGFAGRLPA